MSILRQEVAPQWADAKHHPIPGLPVVTTATILVIRFSAHRLLLGSVLICVTLLAGLVTAYPAQGQDVLPEFHVDVMAVDSGDDSGYARVDLYTRVPFRRLTFLNSPDGFLADYVVTVEALAKEGERLTTTPVQTRIWEGSATADIYLATQSEDVSSYTTQSLQLPPGEYQLSFQVEDRNSSQSFVRDLDVVVRDFSVMPGLSDVVILDEYNEESLEFIPRVSNNVGTEELTMQVLYESYAQTAMTVRIRHEVVRLTRDGEESDAVTPLGGPTPADGAGEPVLSPRLYEDTQTISLEPGRNQHVVSLPLTGMEVGQHVVRVIMEDEAGNPYGFSNKAFTARWNGLERHISDFDQAIDQLAYIAKKRDITYIQDAGNEVDRYRRFRDFWEKRDPTPGTQRNEQMEEYYYRVSFANQRYSSLVEGWRTDRGFVLVRFGEPDFVRKKPHTFDYEPYEVWTYERIGRQFIFVDKTGFGDYQLLVPVWDERTRLY
ncbi:MAG: GWxTD domain-containing protein [Rhodothermales bacterium]